MLSARKYLFIQFTSVSKQNVFLYTCKFFLNINAMIFWRLVEYDTFLSDNDQNDRNNI